MTPEIAGLIGLLILVILLFARMEIAFAMLLIGFLGFAYLNGFKSALSVLATVPYSSVASYSISVVPLFILMGAIASNTGISGDLYFSAHRWAGGMHGGVAIATIAACAGFAAICGSSMASAATMGRVSLPEMKKYNYNPSLAAGSVASGATLGILIPPSLGFIVYGILTEEPIGELFMAGIVPGVLLAILFIIAIIIITKRNPKMGPPGSKTTFRDKIVSLKYTWAMLLLFLLVMGGIYFGIFTPTEAGSIGAFGVIVITAVSRRLSVRSLLGGVMETAQTTAMIMMLMIGAMVLMRFVAISELPFIMADFVSALPLPAYAIFAVIIIFYLILGMFLDVISAEILTVPIIFPSVIAMGFDPIWFGVIMVLVMEMGLITPPVGMNVFILAGVSDIPVNTIFRGVWPFVAMILVCVILVALFPNIALYLPNLMK